MRLIRFVILSCLALSTARTVRSDTHEVTALKIRNKHFDAASRQLSYELWNDTDRAITAWRLGLARGDSHGHGNSSVLDQDFFEQATWTGDAKEEGSLAPGASRIEHWQLDVGNEDPGPVALSLRVVATVFADLDWQGDPTAVATILESRAHRVREIGKVVAALESSEGAPRSRQSWSAELGARAEQLRLERGVSETDAELPRAVAAQLSATRLELADWLDRAGREILLAPNPAASLRQMRLDLEQRYRFGLAAIPEDVASTLVEAQREGGDR